MKNIFTLLVFVITLTALAQAPQGFNYQATVRNNSGDLIVNQNVNFKFNILQNSQNSVPVYSETNLVTTDDLGQVNLVIGQGTAITGTFSTINWGSGPYYLGIELNTGSGYVTMGTTQLLSVPYALYAQNSGNIHLGLQEIIITGDITNEQAAAQIADEAGPLTKAINIYNTKGLTTVDLKNIANLEAIYIQNNNDLTSIIANNLIKCQGMGGSYEYSIAIRWNPSLNSVSFPALKNTVNITFEGNPLINSVSLPSLTTIAKSLHISSGIISSLNFPVLSWVGEGLGLSCKLSSIEFPLLTQIGSYLNLGYNELPSSQINAILHKLLTINPSTGKWVDLSNQTPPSPPTGQGIIDKQTLINSGNTITTD